MIMLLVAKKHLNEFFIQEVLYADRGEIEFRWNLKLRAFVYVGLGFPTVLWRSLLLWEGSPGPLCHYERLCLRMIPAAMASERSGFKSWRCLLQSL